MSGPLLLLHPDPESASPRLTRALEACLSATSAELVTDLETLPRARNRRVLFAFSVDASGYSPGYCALLRWLSGAGESALAGSVAGLAIDGAGELHTKALARDVAFLANQAGCAFVGRPLAEATGSLKNHEIMARQWGISLEDAFARAVAELAQAILEFSLPQRAVPKLLTLHSSNRATSNTLRLYEMMKPALAGCGVTEIELLNGGVQDCIGCPYTTCLHLGQQKTCFYGGAIVEEVFPALEAADGLLLLCPNYNDAVGANHAAFINRLTSLYRQQRFYEKQLWAIIVSGYSGGDLVAKQLIGGLNMNKSFFLPGNFALLETANAPGDADKLPNAGERASSFAERVVMTLRGDCL